MPAPSALTDAELAARVRAHLADADQEALRHGPLGLARYLDPRVVARPHLRAISNALETLQPHSGARVMVFTPPQVGKPVYVGAMILLADGSRKPLGDVRVGDEVITHHGRPRRVSAVHVQGLLPTVTVATASGRSTTAALDHPFLTTEGWVNAGDLTTDHVLATVPRPDYTPSGTLSPSAARLLGYFIGDGCTAPSSPGTFAANITTQSHAVDARIRQCGADLGFTVQQSKATGSGRAWRLNLSGGVRPWLREHGLAATTSWTKRVPPQVFTAPTDVIAEFIAGYWDCDGVVSFRGRDRDGQPRKDVACELYSVSRELLGDVQHLLLRLGIASHIRRKTGAYLDAEHISWRLQLIRSDDVARFRDLVHLAHEKRATALLGCSARRTSFDTPLAPDAVVSVQPTGMKECRCLTVEEDHTFTSDDLVVHNSFSATWGVFNWLCQHPDYRNVIIGCCSTRLAATRGRTIRKYVTDHGHRYGLAVERGSASVTDWRLVGGGGVRSAGTNAGIAGDPGDFALVDDPFSGRADAQSRARRDRVHDWWSADLNARLSPGAPILIVNTRWHVDDLSGRLLSDEGTVEQGGAWQVVFLPAFAQAPNPAEGIPPDGLGRAPGEPLTHPKIGTGDDVGRRAHWEHKRRTSVSRDWASLYQCLPREDKDALVSRALLKQAREPNPPPPVRTAVSIDPSGEGRSTAGIIGGYMAADRRLYVTHDRTDVLTIDEWSERACLLAHETDADVIFVEKNYGGGMAQNILLATWRAMIGDGRLPQHAVMPFVQEVWARKNKRIRAEPMAQQIVLGNLKFRGMHPELEEELATWTITDPNSPGRIDALTHMAFGMLVGLMEPSDSMLHPAQATPDQYGGASGFGNK